MGASQHGGDSGRDDERHRLEDFEDEEIEALRSPRLPPLLTIFSAEVRALVRSGDRDAIQNAIMLALLLVVAVSQCCACLRLFRTRLPALSGHCAQVIVIGRMIYRDLHHDWKDCDADEQFAKHLYCVNISQVHNVLAVSTAQRVGSGKEALQAER